MSGFLTHPWASRKLQEAASIRRQVPCIIGADEYAFDAKEPTKLFVPILPPPRVPCPTPAQFDEVSPLALDLDALCISLNESAPRPAPLVWKSPNERSGPDAPVPGLATSRLRKKRARPHQPQFPVSSVRDDGLDDAIGLAGPSQLDDSRLSELSHSHHPSLDTLHNPPYPSPLSTVSRFAPRAPTSSSSASSPPSFVPYPTGVAYPSSTPSHRRRSSVESATSTLSSPATVFSLASGGNSSWTSGLDDGEGPCGWEWGFGAGKVPGEVGAGWKTVSWD
ncbi:hypothetical protein JCM1841_003886 [Sporobolomyces salmonicolor]